MKMSIDAFRAELRRELQNMHSETDGRKTWSSDEVESIMRGQTDKILSQVMMYCESPRDYAETLSM